MRGPILLAALQGKRVVGIFSRYEGEVYFCGSMTVPAELSRSAVKERMIDAVLARSDPDGNDCVDRKWAAKEYWVEELLRAPTGIPVYISESQVPCTDLWIPLSVFTIEPDEMQDLEGAPGGVIVDEIVEACGHRFRIRRLLEGESVLGRHASWKPRRR